MNNKVQIMILDDSKYVVRFLINRNINIYKIENTKKGIVYTIDYSDLNRIPFDIKIVGYKSIKRYIYTFLRHSYFILGVLISIIELFFFSHIILEVNVIHNDNDIRELIYEELEKNGIRQFMIKKDYDDLQKIKANIKNNNKDKIEWLEIIDEGMKYTVRVEDREIVHRQEEKQYCDIISTKDAVVSNSLIYKGQSNVDVNDFVKKGSILVNGEIKFNEESKSYTCAEAEIFGTTWYKVNIKMPYIQEEKKYTGKSKNNIAIEYKENDYKIFKSHFDKFDTHKKRLIKLGNLSIYKYIEKEYSVVDKKYTTEELVQEALEKAREHIKKKIGVKGSIEDEKVLQTEEYDSIIVMDIFYSIKEPIGKQVEKEIPHERVQSDGTS